MGHPAPCETPGMCLVWVLGPLPAREGLGEGAPSGTPVLLTKLRPPCSPPLQGGRLWSLNAYDGGGYTRRIHAAARTEMPTIQQYGAK